MTYLPQHPVDVPLSLAEIAQSADVSLPPPPADQSFGSYPGEVHPERSEYEMQHYPPLEVPTEYPLEETDPRTEQMWRTGRRVRHHVYTMAGAEPTDHDEPIGIFFTGAMAEEAVGAHNHALRFIRAAERVLTRRSEVEVQLPEPPL